ncbi:MAG: ABC transporter substrate-binding protein, partial [Candidatus Cloacimonadaceae bacterium]|nr:ABC transporter substrate-binding protein [Candidatus Cloacimonadaceae bacterium]
HQAQFAGVYMALKKGFYRNYGLDVEIQSGGSDYPAYESLLNGSTDIVTLVLATAIAKTAQDHELVNLAQVSQKSALMLVGKKSPRLQSINDLNGKKVGLWRSDFQDLPLVFFQEKNLHVKVIPIDWTISLLLNDAVVMMNLMVYNEYHQVLMSGIDKEQLFEIRFSDIGYNFIEDGIYTTREFYEKNPVICKNFAEATMDGWLYAINHQDETLDVVLDIMRRNFIPANIPHQAWMLKTWADLILAKPTSIGVLEKRDFEFAQGLLLKNKVIPRKLDYERFYPHAAE